ncbi:hypothetical protein ABER98_20245 [Domibacillus aminovorans]
MHELTRKEIEARAYPIEMMTARLPDGMKWQFLFTAADYHRDYEEYE